MNSVGNSFKTSKTFSLFLYRQSVYEDGSLAYLINIADGLNGIAFQNKNPKKKHSFFHLKKIVSEVFYSKSQGGEGYAEPPYARGGDNYFNNGIFTDGWSYFGRPIGTPFISPNDDSKIGLPKLLVDASKPEEGYLFTNNNRVIVYHLGFSGEMFKDLTLEGKFSYSQNFGTYSNPFPTNTNQFSMIVKAHKPVTWWRGASVNVAFALDNGSLYQNNIGGYLGIKTAIK